MKYSEILCSPYALHRVIELKALVLPTHPRSVSILSSLSLSLFILHYYNNLLTCQHSFSESERMACERRFEGFRSQGILDIALNVVVLQPSQTPMHEWSPLLRNFTDQQIRASSSISVSHHNFWTYIMTLNDYIHPSELRISNLSVADQGICSPACRSARTAPQTPRVENSVVASVRN